MNKPNLYARIQNIETEVSHLSNSIFTLKDTDIAEQPDNFHSLSMNIALRAERITCQLRSLIYAAASGSKDEYMAQVWVKHNITISYHNSILEIQLPGLLPKRQVHTNTAFLNDPLHYALQAYLYNTPIPTFHECTICFTQIYDQSLDLRRVRDYDNMEFKQVLDTISPFVLHDDSGIYCDTHYTTRLGNQDCTVIHIMEKSKFSAWLEASKKSEK